MSFASKLRHARLDRAMSQAELAKIIGVSDRLISGWERGTYDPKLGNLINVAHALDLSLDYFDEDTGGQRRIDDRIHLTLESSEEIALINDYRSLDRFGQNAVKTICSVELSRIRHESFRSKPQNTRSIPCYESPAAAGMNAPTDNAYYEMIEIDDTVPSDVTCAVKISGESMSPYIMDQSVVYVSSGVELSNNDIGIFNVNGASYCKQFYRDSSGDIYLVSLNPAYSKTNIHICSSSNDSLYYIGKVYMGIKIDLPEYFVDSLKN